MHETDLQLEPNEASDLCPVEAPAVLERRGWDRAFVTVLDEAHAEDALALLGHEAGAEPGDGWHAERIHLDAPSGAGKTEDAEACARHDGHVYALGSQFGSKSGPLNPSRSWIARVPEAALGGDGPAPLEIARLRFGLRHPVSADGHPLLVELDDVEALFAHPGAVPSCSHVWVLENAGDREEPMGIRAMHTEGDDVVDAVVGDLDAAGKGATILADHPAGGRAASRHVRFPLADGGGAVEVETVHEFGAVKRVEGIALGAGGHAHYVIDEEGHVALRTLLLE